MNDRRLGTESQDRSSHRGQPSSRTAEKRERMIDVATRCFAESGYQGARIEDMASEMGIAKGSFFQYFGSKEGLFFAAYTKAVMSRLNSWMDAPEEVLALGFFETIRYWLEETESILRDDWVPYRIVLIGNYGTDLRLKRDINRFLAEDPYGTFGFVDFGIERGEVRTDIDKELIVSMLDWLMERFQDAILTEELDPGLFHRGGDDTARRKARFEQFLELIRSAIGPPA